MIEYSIIIPRSINDPGGIMNIIAGSKLGPNSDIPNKLPAQLILLIFQ